MRYLFLLFVLLLAICRQPIITEHSVHPLTGLEGTSLPIVTGVFSEPVDADVLIEIPTETEVMYLAASTSPLPDSSLSVSSFCETFIFSLESIDTTLFQFRNTELPDKITTAFNIGDHYFTYDEKTLTYNSTWSNIFLLETDIWYDSDLTWHMYTYGGTGYYFCRGTYQEIRWQHITADQPLTLWDTDGNELAVLPDNSFIIFAQYDSFLDSEE